MIEYKTSFRARYAETDQMGIVHHSNYIVWFEMGRIGLMRELGFPYARIESEGYLMPVVEVAAVYSRPARFDDELTLVTEMREKPAARIRFDYRLLDADGNELCSGHSLHGFMNRANRPVKPPRTFLSKMQEYF